MISNRQVPTAVAERNEFQASNMHAEWIDGNFYPQTGQLPSEEADKLRKAYREAGAVGYQLYVVYSYRTPIAWGSSERLYVPDVRYGQTTSKHQNLVRRAL